ncbi:MAG: hypothetical protein IT428_30510, partial [Planctomycetaceae bacterium]|nr:hypothetical protein [Planctomycetaceae bacterium]
RFSCGSDLSGGGGGSNFVSGNVVAIGDARYLRTSGGTLTGALRVQNTISGASLRIDNLKNCDTLDTDGLGNLSCGTDADTQYTAGQGLNLVGTSFGMNSVQTGSLAEFQSVSGSTVHAQTQLRSSGSLAVEGSVFFGAALSTCNLQTNGNGQVTCDTTDYLTEIELDTEAELETQLTDVADVFTNNDGALDDDDLSDNDTDDLIKGSTNLYYTPERVDDRVEALIVDGTNITTVYNDGANTLTINATDTNSTYSAAQGLTLLAGNSFRLNATITGSLVSAPTVSGSLVKANRTPFSRRKTVRSPMPATVAASATVLPAASSTIRRSSAFCLPLPAIVCHPPVNQAVRKESPASADGISDSRAANFARSAGESFATAAVIASRERTGRSEGSVGPAFAFSASLVQPVVQPSEMAAVTSDASTLTEECSAHRMQEVSGSIPLSSTRRKP